MLIKTDVFKAIAAMQWPWFCVRDDDGIVVTGEDVWFCERAKAAGYAIMVDPTISVVHIGAAGY